MTGRITRTTPPPVAASDGTTGVYGITVTAQLTGMTVQALRLYERKGLLQPDRTTGGTRRYSDTDIARLHRISHRHPGRRPGVHPAANDRHSPGRRLRRQYRGRADEFVALVVPTHRT